MKKWAIITVIGIVILIIIGIYFFSSFSSSDEKNNNVGLTDDEIINLTKNEAEKYCQELKNIALESEGERKGV